MEGQLLWDRAMAEALARAVRDEPGALVVGLMGSGHVIHGYGVEHQLRDLGVADVGSLLPWDVDGDCADLVAGVADAVFGILPPIRAKGRSPDALHRLAGSGGQWRRRDGLAAPQFDLAVKLEPSEGPSRGTRAGRCTRPTKRWR
jgi:hypothetical protein